MSDGHVTVLSTIGLNCRCLNVGLLLDRGSIPLISTMNENSDLKCRSFFYRIQDNVIVFFLPFNDNVDISYETLILSLR